VIITARLRKHCETGAVSEYTKSCYSSSTAGRIGTRLILRKFGVRVTHTHTYQVTHARTHHTYHTTCDYPVRIRAGENAGARGRSTTARIKIRSRRRPLLYCGSEESSLPHHAHQRQTSPVFPSQPCLLRVTARAARRAPPVVARQQPLLPRQLVGLLPLPFSLSIALSHPVSQCARVRHPSHPGARETSLGSLRSSSPSPLRRSSVEIPLVTEGDRPSGQLKHDYSPLAAAKNTPRAFTHTCSRLRSRGVPPFALFSSSSADGDEPFSLLLFFFSPSLSLSLSPHSVSARLFRSSAAEGQMTHRRPSRGATRVHARAQPPRVRGVTALPTSSSV